MSQKKKFQSHTLEGGTKSSNNWKKGDLIKAAIIEVNPEETEIIAIIDIPADKRCVTSEAEVFEVGENSQIVSILMNSGEILALDGYIEAYSIEER